MSAEANSTKVVLAALAGNLAIAISKFVAAFVTGSTATLAEAVHSVADTGNQVLLLFGMRLALQKPTEQHPFGRTIERYFWPFVVSIMLFTVGGVFAVYEGIHKIASMATVVDDLTASEHGSSWWNYGVLGTSFLFESYSFSVAWREFRKYKGDRSLVAALVEAKDPTIPVVIMEDTAALLGLAIALVGVGLSDLTGWAGWDGIASLVIGLLLCFVAYFLARETHSLIVGESATVADRRAVARIALAVPGVRGVTQLLSMHRGPDDVLLALKLDFSRDLSVSELEKTTDAVEEAIRKELPHMAQIFIEADSKYDGHADARPDASVLPPSDKPADAP
jgi:cation diffusion facilitator family transporter